MTLNQNMDWEMSIAIPKRQYPTWIITPRANPSAVHIPVIRSYFSVFFKQRMKSGPGLETARMWIRAIDKISDMCLTKNLEQTRYRNH